MSKYLASEGELNRKNLSVLPDILTKGASLVNFEKTFKYCNEALRIKSNNNGC